MPIVSTCQHLPPASHLARSLADLLHPLLPCVLQRPILLKGHSRPLTKVKFNRDGDLLFTCGKDHKPNVWYSENGERLGTYSGHNGSVYDCDINCQPLPPAAATRFPNTPTSR